MRVLNWAVTAAIVVSAHTAVLAEEKKDEKVLTDVAELSFVDTGGNTNVTNLSAHNTLKYVPTSKFAVTWGVNLLFAETEGEKTAERYFTDIRLDYNVYVQFYSFGLVSWLQDELAGIDDRYNSAAGLGYHWLTGPKQLLMTEAGLTYTIEEFIDGTDNEYLGGRAYGKYTYLYSEKTQLYTWGEYLYDFEESENYMVNAEAGILTSVSDMLSLKASYQLKYDNEPPKGATETDTTVAVTLVANLV